MLALVLSSFSFLVSRSLIVSTGSFSSLLLIPRCYSSSLQYLCLCCVSSSKASLNSFSKAWIRDYFCWISCAWDTLSLSITREDYSLNLDCLFSYSHLSIASFSWVVMLLFSCFKALTSDLLLCSFFSSKIFNYRISARCYSCLFRNSIFYFLKLLNYTLYWRLEASLCNGFFGS